MNLVAIEATKRKDLWNCFAQATSLYKIRVDAGKVKKSVWESFPMRNTGDSFLLMKNGLLWQSDPFLMSLRKYKDTEVSNVYRLVYYMVKLERSRGNNMEGSTVS